MSKSESEIQKEILTALKKHPSIAWIDRANSGKVKVRGGFMQLHENGTPDLIGYTIYGEMVGVEVKDEANFNKKNHGLRDEQVSRLLDMMKHSCLCGVACTVEQAIDIANGNYIGLGDL